MDSIRGNPGSMVLREQVFFFFNSYVLKTTFHIDQLTFLMLMKDIIMDPVFFKPYKIRFFNSSMAMLSLAFMSFEVKTLAKLNKITVLIL